MFNWFKKKNLNPSLPEHHLGYSTMKYQNEGGPLLDSCTIHFFAKLKDEKFIDRRVTLQREITGHNSTGKWKDHTFYQEGIIPWLHGGNVWSPICNPSSFLIDFTERKGKWKWKGKEETNEERINSIVFQGERLDS